MIICLFASLYTSIWTVLNSDDYWYLDLNATINSNFIVMLLTNFGTWFIIFMNLVPISLIVTLEVVKFI